MAKLKAGAAPSNVAPVIPMTEKLESLSGSGIRTFIDCQRMFYWKYIRNIILKQFNKNLSAGTAFHAGIATLFETKNIIEAMKTIDTMEEAIRKDSFLSPAEEEELQYSIVLVRAMLSGWYELNGLLLSEVESCLTELEFKLALDDFFPDYNMVPYVGIVDLMFKKNGLWYIGEHKTKGQITDTALQTLSFNWQINGYPVGIFHQYKKQIHSVYYNVIRKAAIRQTKKETEHEFLDRLKQEYASRPEWYYFTQWIVCTEQQTNEAMMDIVHYNHQITSMCKRSNFQDVKAWPRNEEGCYNLYKSLCPYFNLCKYGADEMRLLPFVAREKR